MNMGPGRLLQCSEFLLIFANFRKNFVLNIRIKCSEIAGLNVGLISILEDLISAVFATTGEKC